jgi:hypothetical protein
MVATSQGRGSTWATGQDTLKTYPPAPSNFVAAPDVVTLWTRFEGFSKGREPLASMAYFCFSVLKFRYRGRRLERKSAYNPTCFGSQNGIPGKHKRRKYGDHTAFRAQGRRRCTVR